jgi:hypothetical protein
MLAALVAWLAALHLVTRTGDASPPLPPG